MADRRRGKGGLRRMLERRVAASKAGGFFFLKIANPIDKRLVPLTRGHLSMVPGAQVLVLETVGAKSGQVRRTPLQYDTDGDDIVLIASKAGAPKHPGWYHNLRAKPEANLFVKGGTGRYTAAFPEGAEYDRLWKQVNELYSGYDRYQERAGARKIPLVVLSRAAS
jgi:deazaflavin-dependent oxidoreductase (nitroreductase family)